MLLDAGPDFSSTKKGNPNIAADIQVAGILQAHGAIVRAARARIINGTFFPRVLAIELKSVEDNRSDEFSTAQGWVGIFDVFGIAASAPGDFARIGVALFVNQDATVFVGPQPFT